MSLDSEFYRLLQTDRINVIQKLTELNGQHIKSQGRLSGIEIETARCEEAIVNGDTSENFKVEIDRLTMEYSEIMQSRAVIDGERDALELKLQELDNQLAAQASVP